MSRSVALREQHEDALDEYAISELTRFFLLLDKWDREAKGEVVKNGCREEADSERV
jgi:hypothetical protein